MPKFVVQFYMKVSEAYPKQEYKRTSYNFQVLTDNEKKLKPPNCFRFENRSFLFVPKCVKALSKNGYPIIEYTITNTIPDDMALPQEPDIPENPSPEAIKIASDLFDVTFARGEEKSVIAGSQKTKDELSTKSLIIGALIGAGITGMVLMILFVEKVIK